MHDEMLYFRAFPSCRDFLDSIRSDVYEMQRIDSMLVLGVESTHKGKGSGIGDPTSGKAIYEAETKQSIIDRLKERREELETHIGYSLRFVECVKKGFLDPAYSEVIELHYIDCMTWGKVSIELGRDKRTCMRMRDVVCDWADYRGASLFVDK